MTTAFFTHSLISEILEIENLPTIYKSRVLASAATMDKIESGETKCNIDSPHECEGCGA